MDEVGQGLTDRQREMLMHVANGRRIKEIARIENVKEATVRNHLDSARERLGARTLPHAVSKALQAGELLNVDREAM